MLTFEERIHMYNGKKLFIEGISKVFENESLRSNVKTIDYVVLTKVIDENTTDYREFVMVTFTSGACAIRTISGNSNNANFREIGKLIDGGYYDEVPYYTSLLENGYTELKF